MKILTTLMLSALGAIATAADIPSQTLNFTASEGFVDGPASGQKGIWAQKAVQIDTSDGGGLTSPTAGFQRTVAFHNAIALDQLEVGDTATLVARGVQVQRGLPSQIRPFMAFGLVFDDLSSKLAIKLGCQLLFDAEERLWIDDQDDAASKAAVETQLQYDQPFDLTLTITRTGPRAFTADTTVNGVTIRTGTLQNHDLTSASLMWQLQGKTQGHARITALALNPQPEPFLLEEPH